MKNQNLSFLQSNLNILLLGLFIISMYTFGACEKETDTPPELEQELEQEEEKEEEEEQVLKSDTVYINHQTDFDSLKNSEFTAGTHILFAAGVVFNGQFAPTGSGTADSLIILTAYNQKTGEIYLEDIDNKPIINGHGKVDAPFYLYNGGNWEINNLEITNTDGTDNDQGDLKGIHVVAKDVGIVENITIHNCYVHDVNGHVGGQAGILIGGILVEVIGKDIKTKFHNLLIENNYVREVGGVGISNQTKWRSINNSKFYPWTNYIVRGNRIERTGRNSMVIRASTNPVSEYNVVAYSSLYSTGHNMYNFNTIGCVMQYNEAYGNRGDIDDKDRGGFDADYNAENTTIQYNYSHDNHWFVGIMRKYNKGVVIRYNISVNDRVGAYHYGFPTDFEVENVQVYNNTHYFGAGINASPVTSPGKTRIPIKTSFYNNIFYFAEPSTWVVSPDNSCKLSNNLFYNVAPKGDNAITNDPLFVNAGVEDTDIDMHDPERLAGYKLKDGSPAIGAGMIITKNGGKDFWGNPIGTEAIDIGAHEQ